MRHAILTLLLASIAGSTMAAQPPAESLQAYVGSYSLADGRQLTVTESDGQLKAEIVRRPVAALAARSGGGKQFTLVPEGPGRFVAKSAPLEINFAGQNADVAAFVRVNEERMTMQALARR